MNVEVTCLFSAPPLCVQCRSRWPVAALLLLLLLLLLLQHVGGRYGVIVAFMMVSCQKRLQQPCNVIVRLCRVIQWHLIT